ncbi:MAG: class I SAM-dependent methyltransferase [Actinobacteria bacterium]|nr:class I SAM-dependent methyltransferase [Actinomycetota bacterium]
MSACVACGRASMLPWRAARPSDARLAALPAYELLRCAACGTAAVAPAQRGRETAPLYSEGTYRMRGRLDALLEPLRRLIDRDRLRAIGRLPAHAQVLEVGAGDGRLLAALAARGQRVGGIEPSAPYAAAARARGLDVATVGVEAAERAPESADAVVLWHVLEHLDDPAAALQRARAWLRPGGRLVIAVPNRASWQASLGGDRWFHQDVPRHLTHFTPRGLSALLERCGFRVTRTRHLLLEHNALGMWLTLLNRLTRERDVAFRLLKRARRGCGARGAADVALTLLAGPLLAPLAVALELLAGLLRRGGTIVVLAR